jgi:hypothetical protein
MRALAENAGMQVHRYVRQTGLNGRQGHDAVSHASRDGRHAVVPGFTRCPVASDARLQAMDDG